MATDRIRLSDAAAILGNYRGKPLHTGTIRRWAAKGVKVAGGRRVKLQSLWIGGHVFTTREWVENFITECNEEPAETEAREWVHKRMTRSQLDRELTLRGFRGAKAKRELLGVRKGGSRARAVQGVLPGGPVCDADRANNGTRTSRSGATGPETRDAAERLPLDDGRAAASTRKNETWFKPPAERSA